MFLAAQCCPPAEKIVDGLLADPKVGVVWLTCEEALSLPWESVEQREIFQPLYVACLQHALGSVEAGSVAAQIFISLAEAKAVSVNEGF